MKRLNEKDWKASEIKDIFTIRSGVRLESRNRNPGDRPFIGALDNSNGVVQFVDDINASLDGNVLGVNYNGNGMGIGFYHPYQCIFSDDVKRFHLKGTDDTAETMLFSKALIEKQRSKFGYLYKFNAKRMAATSIMLPITDSGEPDYEYMAEYVQECRKAMLAKYRAYVEARIAELGNYVEIPALNEVEWRDFKVEELFTEIVPTKGQTTAQLIEGDDVPYIAASKINNGYVFMCSSKEHPEWVSNGNTIVFVQLGDGAAGIAHYVPMNFIGMGGKTSCGYNSCLTKYSGLFIAKCLSSNKAIFSHGHSWTGRRLLNTKTMLPTNSDGDPNYLFMEQYVKNIMLRKYKQYLTFLDSKDKQSK